MASFTGLIRNANQSEYWVVHPLDDLPEQKRDVSALGTDADDSQRAALVARAEGLLVVDDGLGRLPLSRPCSRAQASVELSTSVDSRMRMLSSES